MQHFLGSWLPTTHIRRPAEMHLSSLTALSPRFPPEGSQHIQRDWLHSHTWLWGRLWRAGLWGTARSYTQAQPHSPLPWAGPGKHTQTPESETGGSDFPCQKGRNSHLPLPSFLATGLLCCPQHQHDSFGEKQGVSLSNFCKQRLRQLPSWARNPK